MPTVTAGINKITEFNRKAEKDIEQALKGKAMFSSQVVGPVMLPSFIYFAGSIVLSTAGEESG